jgi:hypothetical protein
MYVSSRDKSTYLEFRTREEFLKLEVFAMSLRYLVCEELRNQDAGGKLVQGLLPLTRSLGKGTLTMGK